MEVCIDHVVQNGVFVGNARRHALLIHIDIVAAGNNTEYVYVALLSVELSLIDACYTHVFWVKLSLCSYASFFWGACAIQCLYHCKYQIAQAPQKKLA